jgi:hypothetical protein
MVEEPGVEGVDRALEIGLSVSEMGVRARSSSIAGISLY